MAALQYLWHLFYYTSLSVGDMLSPSLDLHSALPFLFRLQGGQTSKVHQSINPMSWTPTGFRLSHQPLLMHLKRADRINTYFLLTCPTTSPYVAHTITPFIDFTQLWEIFKKKNDRNVIYGGWFPRKYLCNHSSALCLRSLIFSHHPPTVPTFSISCFSALVCLWHHKAGTVGCRDSEPVRCVRGISTPWDTEKTERDRNRELLQLQRSVMCYEVIPFMSCV